MACLFVSFYPHEIPRIACALFQLSDAIDHTSIISGETFSGDHHTVRQNRECMVESFVEREGILQCFFPLNRSGVGGIVALHEFFISSLS